MELLEDLLNMVINKEFRTELCSDLDFEGMVVDVCFDAQRIAMVNYDKGIDNIEIEILSRKEAPPRLFFSLDGFFNILEEARAIAIRCAKEDELRNQ